MAQFLDGHTVILAGYGFGEHGPYITFDDIDDAQRYQYPLVGNTFSLFRDERRFCVGRFDLRTHESSVCPLRVEFLPSEKDDMCPACKEATGFNPSFYYADTISPQQREYNQTPHYVYLAYFSPDHVKAGISSETRGIERLLEQGARSACIVGRFSDADAARSLEAALCSQEGIAETMRVSLKERLLAKVPYDATQAAQVLEREIARLSLVEEVSAAGFAPEGAQDLTPYYFAGVAPQVSELQIPENANSKCAGTCIGMVGGLLVLQQDHSSYVISLKEWESHVVKLYTDEVCVTYDAAPQQFSLF